MSALDLLEARLLLQELARPSVAYCRTHGLDWDSIEAACGGVYLAPIRADHLQFFDFDPAGVLAPVCAALDEDGATVLDLVAWSARNPAKVRTAIGAAPALGMAAAVNPTTYIGGSPLKLYRTPLAWLKAHCDGTAILDVERGARWLVNLGPSTLAAEDDAHALELHDARCRLIQSAKIVVPNAARAA